MKKTIFLALAMIAFSGCDKANSAECPDLQWGERRSYGTELYMTARDDISIHNIIINRGNCAYHYNSIDRNGVDKLNDGNKPLTNDVIENSNYREETKKELYEELKNGPKRFAKNIDLKFGDQKSIMITCKPLEVILETNLGQCEYKF